MPDLALLSGYWRGAAAQHPDEAIACHRSGSLHMSPPLADDSSNSREPVPGRHQFLPIL